MQGHHKIFCWLTILAGALTVAGCGKDRVTFVTSTVIGFDADPKKLALDLGYGRQELITGPAYEDGGIPAVYGHLDSNLGLLNQKVAQMYATGDAATILAGGKRESSNDKLKGESRRMIFGTGSVFGLRLGFEGQNLPSVTLGYKRLEYSNIPLRENTLENNEAVYHSALAAIAIAANVSNFEASGVGLNQFIATGTAAEKLAENHLIKNTFVTRSLEMLNKTRAVFAPDEKSDAIRKIFKKTGDACRQAYIQWAKSKNYEPMILIYGKNLGSARDKAIEFLKGEAACDESNEESSNG